MSRTCQENTQKLGLQDVFHCYTADFFQVAVLAPFDTSIVRKFELTHIYTTAAMDDIFALLFYCFALVHGVVVYSDCFNAEHFVKAYKTAFPRRRSLESGSRPARDRLPSELCRAYVRGGDGINSPRPLWSWDCGVLPEEERLAIVLELAQSIREGSEDLWSRSRGNHHIGFGRHINYQLEPRHYERKSFLISYTKPTIVFFFSSALTVTYYSSSSFFSVLLSSLAAVFFWRTTYRHRIDRSLEEVM